MTETEWMVSIDPVKMLQCLPRDNYTPAVNRPPWPFKVSERKLRLIACTWYFKLFTTDHWIHPVIEAVRHWADGKISREEAMDTSTIDGADKGDRYQWYLFGDIERCFQGLGTFNLRSPTKGRDIAAYIRDVVGNPWHPVTVPEGRRTCQWCIGNGQGSYPGGICYPCDGRGWFAAPCPWLTWNDGVVLKMAQSIYEARTFDQMSILGDALQDAGCHDQIILDHCSGLEFVDNRTWVTQPLRGPHIPGCWVLDLLRGVD